jgi:hypothetical protein
MPEGNINAEVADHLRGHDRSEGRQSRRRIEITEIIEAVVLGLVALATAWSGYQAAKWDGESALEYAEASRLNVEAQQMRTESTQYLQYNADTLDSWLQATTSGNEELAALLENRFTPEYKEAFEAWVETDPLTDPDAPPGPGFMPEFEDSRAERAAETEEEAHHAFALGVETRATAEKYVRITVILAAVLFLVAIGQRFSLKGVRAGVTLVAAAFLIYAVALIATLPKV